MIEFRSVQKVRGCERYASGKCPIKNVMEVIEGDPKVTLREAVQVLTEEELALRNEMYGAGLNADRMKSATEGVITADCVFNKGCSVLVANNKRNKSAGTIVAAWIIDTLPKKNKHRIVKSF